MFCFGRGTESKSKTKTLEFSFYVSLEIINNSPVTETVCPNLNRQKQNASPVSPFFSLSLCNCLGDAVSRLLGTSNGVWNLFCVFENGYSGLLHTYMWKFGAFRICKIIKLFTKSKMYSLMSTFELQNTGQYCMEVFVLSISSQCNVVPISRCIKNKQYKIICTHERIMVDFF